MENEMRISSTGSPTMNGKTVLITGANSGVGFVTARELAKMGARVLMVCRDPERGRRARAAVATTATGPAPELLLADLSSQAAIRALSHDLHRRLATIDVLVNNAGGIFAHREVTADGIERTFATNHLGPFLLTNLLLDLVRTGTGARIVNVASESYSSKLDFDNLQGEKSYGFLSAYFRSKLENIIFTLDLAKRLHDTGVTVNCVSPGPSRTRFGDNMTGLASLFPRLTKLLFPSPEKGARTLIYLASSPEVAGVSGRFFLRQRIRRTKPVTQNDEVAARLWRVSAELVGLSAERPVAQRDAGLGTPSALSPSGIARFTPETDPARA
jgi:NAD(P)-dependent dehydrogenase (short-subunit alcohol dehydrogenase family)